MAVSTNLELLVLAESQANKMTGVNLGFAGLEAALTERLILDTASATTANFRIPIPFVDTNDLSTRLALRFMYLVLTTGATASFIVDHPLNKHVFFVTNTTSQTASIRTVAATFGVTVLAGETKLVYCDGANMQEIPITGAGGTTQAYDIDVAVYGAPTNGQIVGRYTIGRAVTLPANLTGSVGSVLTNPTATNTFDIDDDGVKIGEISISTGGVVTFTTVSGTAKEIAAGSVLVVHNQATADATLAGLSAAILGTIASL